MDQQSHWDTIGSNYGGEIFDVFHNDKKKILTRYFKKHSNKAYSAIDFGCGIGKAFPYLAPAFAHVHAADISAELLSIAKQCRYKNISYQRADLSKSNLRIPKADFAFCCNVIMLPEVDKNFAMFRNIGKSLKPGGTGLIVVPALESIFYSSWRLIEWYRKEGVDLKKIPDAELDYFKGSKKEMVQGIMYIDGVPTKHYSESEIHVLFRQAGLEVTAVEKIEYEWDTEFSEPPKWMKEPFPWDWMVEVRTKNLE